MDLGLLSCKNKAKMDTVVLDLRNKESFNLSLQKDNLLVWGLDSNHYK